jgi:hypothetical protein
VVPAPLKHLSEESLGATARTRDGGVEEDETGLLLSVRSRCGNGATSCDAGGMKLDISYPGCL